MTSAGDSDRNHLPAASAAPLQPEAELRETLKRCSPATYEAAAAFRRTGDLAFLPAIVRGVIERYVEPDLRAKMHQSDPSLRLCEDLGLDSLTMMEIVLLAEDVLHISITHDELRQLRTVGDVQQFMVAKLGGTVPLGIDSPQSVRPPSSE